MEQTGKGDRLTLRRLSTGRALARLSATIRLSRTVCSWRADLSSEKTGSSSASRAATIEAHSSRMRSSRRREGTPRRYYKAKQRRNTEFYLARKCHSQERPVQRVLPDF